MGFRTQEETGSSLANRKEGAVITGGNLRVFLRGGEGMAGGEPRSLKAGKRKIGRGLALRGGA